MYSEISQISIIKNSSGETYFFYLDIDNIVKYERYSNKNDLINTNNLHKDKIIDFSADIDKNDRIHVLCLTYEGKLIYFLYANLKWSSSIISNFDLKSNKYSNLTFKANSDNLHIMYAFSNLINSSAWTIQHIMCIKNKWEKVNVISITTGKSTPHFNFSFDKFDNIHMAYKLTSKGKESIYYISFNILLKKWNSVPQLISDANSSLNTYPYLFVDSKDNIHIVWCTSMNDEYQLSYKHLLSSGYNSFRWKFESLPVQKSYISYPIIYEEKNLIKVAFIADNVLKTINSSDSGFTWKVEYEKDLISPAEQKPVHYSSNFQIENSKFKIHDLYLDTEEYFIQLPNFLYTLEKPNNFKKDDLLYEGIEQKEISPSFEETTILHENISAINNEAVRDFIMGIKNSFEVIDSNDDRFKELKSKIEKIILDNSLCLDQKITDYSRSKEEILTSLDNLALYINSCKKENQSILELVSSLKEVITNRESAMLSLENQINSLKEALNSYFNQSTLKKIINAFKKEA